MAQDESQSEHAEELSPLSLSPTQVIELGTERGEEFVSVQRELFSWLQETNQRWLERMQAEAHLVAEFASKFTEARIEMVAEDYRRLLDDAQKLMATGSRLLPNGWPSSRPNMST